jgi:methylated-DNA-[protein]-cysteine S-methyltransferase
MMNFAVFGTAIGRCGIVWSEGGIAGVQLPERSEAATRKRMLRRFPAARESAPPAGVRRSSTILLRCSAASTEISIM